MAKMMNEEIRIATRLISDYIQRYGSLDSLSLENFRSQLEEYLVKRFDGHWYPDKPIKGQAYRVLDFTKINGYCDDNIHNICERLHLDRRLLGFQHEFTLWIDPYDVSIRLGSAVSQKSNEQFVVVKYDQNQNKIFEQDLDSILSKTRISFNSSRRSPVQETRAALPVSVAPSVFQNNQLVTPPRTLSPTAPEFLMTTNIMSAPLSQQIENVNDSIEESYSGDENQNPPERSDTPHSMHSVTSNESSDSGYCGYVESYPYYYKLNRLQKALAFQQHQNKKPNTGPRPSRSFTQKQHKKVMPQFFERSQSPPTPTPANIDQWAQYYRKPSYIPMHPLANQHGNMNY